MRHSRAKIQFALTLAAALHAACGPMTVSPDIVNAGDASSDTTDASPDATMDATPLDTPVADATQRCISDNDCSDNVYCNGAERCMPGAATADARGCVPAAAPPCGAMQTCVEATMLCDTTCPTPDSDADGHRSIACGGDDCDDTDGNRYPSNTEVCDAAGHDEDCDACTIAGTSIDGDADLDTFVSISCFNAYAGPTPTGCDPLRTRVDGPRTRVTGSDCDDTNPNVRPNQTESCNGIDDNCNQQVDEGVSASYFADCDGDGYGTGTPVISCSAPSVPAPCTMGIPRWVTVDGDCDDTHAPSHPMGAEVCDGRDNDCDGTMDNEPTSTTACGTSMDGTPVMCAAGACTLACTTGRGNCDALVSNGCEVDLARAISSCGTCGNACGYDCVMGACVDAVEITTGGDFACMRRTNGGIVCWGANNFGQHGDGTTTIHRTPVPVMGIADAIGVSSAGSINTESGHTCVVRAGGTVECWGSNANGELGNGAANAQSMPSPVTGISDAVEVASGAWHSCARRATGAVVCWGNGLYGQLGDGVAVHTNCPGFSPLASMNGGSVDCARAPVAVTGLMDAVEIAVGLTFSCARRATGAVVCWGDNGFGALGDGSGTHATTCGPFAVDCSRALVTVSGLMDAVQIAASGEHACARRATGAVVCWGSNARQALGDGVASHSSCTYGPLGTSDCSRVPVAVAGLVDAADVSVGGDDLGVIGRGGSTCAARVTGVVACWGSNDFWETGSPASTDVATPSTVPSITDAVAVAAGPVTCAMHRAGGVACWGSNINGELGDNATHTTCPRVFPSDCSATPVEVARP